MSRRTDRAFTLLEIMVAMSLFTIIGLAVVTLMSTGVDMWLRGNRAAQDPHAIAHVGAERLPREDPYRTVDRFAC